MELFDKFTKKNEETNSLGWDAITELCDKIGSDVTNYNRKSVM